MNAPPPRRPQVFDADDPAVRPSPPQADAFGARSDDPTGADAPSVGSRPGTASLSPSDADHSSPPVQTKPPGQRPGRFGVASAFLSAVFLLSSIAIGVWFSRFVSVAVARDDWIGWTAKGLALFIAAVVVLFILREILGFFRLARLGRLRREVEHALASGDVGAEQRAVAHLERLVSGRAEYRWALAAFRDQKRHQTAPGALLRLADSALLAAPDREARRIIYESARRVAVVTAVVPMAIISVLFVLFENVRMLRRLAAAYGGRPGVIGGWRLLLRVIFHIAATGAIALTDDLFGQFLGQDIMRRLSARLGEGAFNGALTARLGIVAIELTRPAPYIKAKPLRARHVIAELFPEFSASELIGRAVGRNRDSGDDARR